jgi:hypothetical protein
VCGELGTPDIGQQLAVRDHLAGLAHQPRQQRKFGGREVHFSARH